MLLPQNLSGFSEYIQFFHFFIHFFNFFLKTKLFFKRFFFRKTFQFVLFIKIKKYI